MNFTESISTRLFLSHKFKLAGYLLLLPGLIIIVLRFFYDWKPDFLETKAFAFYSTYLNTSYMKVIENNLVEEIGGTLIAVGLCILFFSRERNEKPEYYYLRYKALLISQFLYFIYLIISILFVYGIAFIKFAFLGLIFPSITYLLVFNYFLVKERKLLKH